VVLLSNTDVYDVSFIFSKNCYINNRAILHPVCSKSCNLILLEIKNILTDVNILGGSVHTIKKNTDALAVASKGNGLQVNADKSKYKVMS